MKKLFVSAIVALSSMMAFAQTDTVNADNDTHVYNSFVSRNGKNWKFNFLSISTESSTSTSSTVNVNVPDVNVNVPDVNVTNNTNININVGRTHKRTEIGLDKFYLGVSSLGKTDGFELNPAGSLEFGFSIMSSELYNRHRTFGVEAALFTSWTRYSVKNKDVFYYVGDKMVCNNLYIPEGSLELNDYSRSRLTYASWRVPVTLNWCGDNVKYSLGVEGELRHHLRSRVKYGKDKKHYARYGDMDVNPWGANLLLAIGSSNFQFFGRYSLTQFFDTKNTDFKGTPFMIGIIWK